MEKMIDIPIKNISKKDFKNFDEKYLYLFKKKQDTQIYISDLTKMLDFIVNLAVLKKNFLIFKKILKLDNILVDIFICF